MSHNFHRRYGPVANANTPVAKAWEIAQAIPAIREDYEGQAKIYHWSPQHALYDLTPHWAYWFARHVITDHWPAGESLIQQDQQVLGWYNAYKNNCQAVGILNHSVQEDPDFIIDDNGQIVGWKEGRKPLKKGKVTSLIAPEEDLDAIADRIAERMAAFRREKQMRVNSHEDNDEG